MDKSFLFNISQKEGLPGGPNEVDNNILGSISISQHVFTPDSDDAIYMELDDDEIEEYRKGGWIINEVKDDLEEFGLGGFFKRKRKKDEPYEAGSWSGEPTDVQKIYGADEDQFEMPISKTPDAQFELEEMTEEELQVYLQKQKELEFQEKYKAAYDQYKPLEVSYKSVDRPTAEFVLQETYEANPEAFTNQGYTAHQLESGHYELFANKDISDMIYKRGFKGGVLSKTFGLGEAKELEEKFAPVYADAKRIHAKRNYDKINKLFKEKLKEEITVPAWEIKDDNSDNKTVIDAYTYTKETNKYETVDDVIDELVRQGEGTKYGLTQLYGDYAQGIYDENHYSENLEKLVREKYDQTVEETKAQLESDVSSWDVNAIASVDQPILTASYNDQGEFTGYKDNTAYNKNLNAVANYTNYVEGLENSPERIARDAMVSIAQNSDLTNDQKRELLSDPTKLENIFAEYANWENAEEGVADVGYSGYYRGGNLKSNFNIDPETGEAVWQEGSYPYVIDGPVNMLDKEWIKGTVGVIAAPAAFTQLANLMNFSAANAGLSIPLAESMTAGNLFTGIGAYEAGTKYLPGAWDAGVNIYEEGANRENVANLFTNLGEATFKTLSGTKLLSELNVLKSAPKITGMTGYKTTKDLYSQGKYGTRLATEQLAPVGSEGTINPTTHMKFIKSLAPYLKKQEGGVVYKELTDEQIKQYRKEGWIIDET